MLNSRVYINNYKFVCMRLAIILTISLSCIILFPVFITRADDKIELGKLPYNEDKEYPDIAMVIDEIKRQSTIDVETSLRIAFCESRFKYDAKNPNSTAKGIYQFLDGTWDWIGAEGHQFNYKENIKQFMKIYPDHKGYWECK